jgi:sporulation protein YlmC with PRC-barrel domain
MSRIQLLSTLVGIGLLIAHPSLAQIPAPSPPAAASVPAGSLERVQNAWRARSLLGASVFNENGQRVATVRDLLLTDDAKVDRVVLAVGSRHRLVAVPFDQLRFVPSQRFDTPVLAVRGRTSRMVSASHADRKPYGIMLLGVTQASLLQMESFQLTP